MGEALLKVANGNPKYIFWSGNGEPVTVAKDFSGKLKQVFDKSGVKAADSHRFRKTFGVELLTHGAPLEMVSRALGHRKYGNYGTPLSQVGSQAPRAASLAHFPVVVSSYLPRIRYRASRNLSKFQGHSAAFYRLYS